LRSSSAHSFAESRLGQIQKQAEPLPVIIAGNRQHSPINDNRSVIIGDNARAAGSNLFIDVKCKELLSPDVKQSKKSFARTGTSGTLQTR